MKKYLRTKAKDVALLPGLLSLIIFASVGLAQQQELWVYKHKGEGDRNIACAHAIVYGSDGNTYIAGKSRKASLTQYYFTVISLNPDSSLRWEYYCDQEHPFQAYDEAFSLVHTGDTLVYAVGRLLRASGYWDFTFVCLDSRTGQQVWKRFFGGLGDDAEGFAVTCDEDGNAYACGYLYPGATSLFYVVSLTPEGDTRWTYDTTGNAVGVGENRALSMVYGPGNYLYVAGYLTNRNSPNRDQPDAVVIALHTEESVPQRRRWTYVYNYANLQDSATSIAKGSDGHLYVAGGSNANFISTYWDIFVAALDSATGSLLWPQVFRWNGTGPSGHGDIASRIVYGSDDNLYLCGRSDTTWWDSTPRHSDYYVMSIVKDNPVTPRWCFRYGPINKKNDYAQSIVYGLDDNIYTAGQTAYTDGDELYTVVSLDKDDGGSRFTYLYPQPNPNTSFQHWASDIVYGVDGCVYSCGATYFRALDPSCSLTVVKIGTPNLLANGNTYPSQARHLVKDPFSSNLHAVFQRDNNIYYRISTDAGTTWGGAQYLGHGTSPSICLAQSPFFAKIPCVVYCDVDTLNRFHYHWQGFSGWEHAILPVPGANPCTPSAVAAGDTVFIGYEMRWEYGEQEVPCIMVKRLHYSTPASQIDTVIAGTDVGTPEMPCLSVDDNFTVHAVWRHNGDGGDDIAYSYRKPDSSWKQATKVRNLPYSPSMHPFCECYGDSVYVVWCEQDTSAHESLEVWRAARKLPSQWEFRNVSLSSSLSSESPTQANRQFVVWAEQISGSNFDVKYRRYKPDGQVDSGFVAQNTTCSYWPHSQFDFISPTTYLYSLRTEDNDAVYFQNQVFASDEDFLFYRAEAGNQGRSPYCTKRDSFISYEKCPVDIARDELVYDLSFFDPAYTYKIKAVVYHEGIARKAKISLDNCEIAAYSFPESKVETISVWIPPEAYRQDHRATLRVKNVGGDYAVMGPLLVYRYAKRPGSQGGGGVQSSEITDALRRMRVTVAPTVTRRTFAVSYDLPFSARVAIELFDVTGRRARSILSRRQRPGTYRIVLNADELASGVYFLRFSNQVKTETRKVVVSK